mgnify:CR=1 FL=1|jgi:hypothetical protein
MLTLIQSSRVLRTLVAAIICSIWFAVLPDEDEDD